MGFGECGIAADQPACFAKQRDPIGMARKGEVQSFGYGKVLQARLLVRLCANQHVRHAITEQCYAPGASVSAGLICGRAMASAPKILSP